MFNWDLIFKHEERMEELAIERLKLETEKLRLEVELAKARGQKDQCIVPKGFNLALHPKPSFSPYRSNARWGGLR